MRWKDWLFYKGALCCLPGLIALPGYAKETISTPESKEIPIISQEERPSEEFWLFMAEFSEDEELIDPQDLAELDRNKQLKISSNAERKLDEVSVDPNVEESL